MEMTSATIAKKCRKLLHELGQPQCLYKNVSKSYHKILIFIKKPGLVMRGIKKHGISLLCFSLFVYFLFDCHISYSDQPVHLTCLIIIFLCSHELHEESFKIDVF